MPAPSAVIPPPPPPPPSQSAPQQRRVQPRTPQVIAPKVFVHGPAGWGKTSKLAYAPSPLILMAKGDRGYDTLLSSGRAPRVPAEVVESFDDANAWIDSLIADQQGVKTLGLDGAGYYERMCHEKVCREKFGGDWSGSGFLSYHKGYDVAVTEWLGFLSRLEALSTKGVEIWMLGHSRVKEFHNPLAADYDRYEPDMHHKTWAPTERWADAVLFATFYTVVDLTRQERGKAIAEQHGKGIGGQQRVVYTENCDAYVAKNRYGMDPAIFIQGGPETMYQVLKQQMTKGATK